jgi:hypothetical protein
LRLLVGVQGRQERVLFRLSDQPFLPLVLLIQEFNKGPYILIDVGQDTVCRTIA